MQLFVFVFCILTITVSGLFHPTKIGGRFLKKTSLEVVQKTPPIVVDSNGNYRGCYCKEQGIKAKSTTCSVRMCGVYNKEEKIRKQAEGKTTKK